MAGFFGCPIIELQWMIKKTHMYLLLLLLPCKIALWSGVKMAVYIAA